MVCFANFSKTTDHIDGNDDLPSLLRQVHVVTKELVQLGMFLLKLLVPCKMVDYIILMLSKLIHGDLSCYGLPRPVKGPFYLKGTTGQSPVIDVGTIDKIKTGDIQVLPSIRNINGDSVEFANGKVNQFDAIVFATGYKSSVQKWLKDGASLFNEDGMPKRRVPDHWKGENGLYCAGFSRAGLVGISNDAQNIAKDISIILGQYMN
uniref:indole-3-pyruvate monooxygenase n=1 Tax=Davidia involucrata TaxID=16924 RepID=A0A5B6YT43_DAVIN